MTQKRKRPVQRRVRGTPSRANRNITWIEKHCRIPEGKDVGQLVKLRNWQKRDLRKIYNNPHGTRTAIISFAKKNGKTSLAAFLVLLHLVGPEAKRNTQLPSTAQSREQAAFLFNLAAKIVRLSPTLSPVIIIRDTVKELACPELGTLYRALSAEASTAHGASPAFAVHDELGQVKGPRSELFNAVENAMGAHEAPLSIIISTQAPTDADLLSILIDDALSDTDPRVVISLYTADPDIDAFSKKALRQANPALGDFLNEQEVLDQAAKAKRMRSQEALYRNFTLNQRVEASNPFVAPGVWAENGAAPDSDWSDRPVYAGLDLSEVTDLTALVLASPFESMLDVRSTFWLPEIGLADRAREDRVPYDLWRDEGFLETTPGKSIGYEYVAEQLMVLIESLDIRKIAFDRWNMRHLKPWLIKAGMTEEEFEQYFEPFGQGFQSMSPALRELESLLVNGRVRHGNHPALTMCALNAVVNQDPAGNRKLDKKRSRGRIDGMVALAMAASLAAANLENSGKGATIPMAAWL